MPRKETYSGPLSAQAQQDLVSEGIENYELPKSLVMKIAKSAVRMPQLLAIIREVMHRIDTREYQTSKETVLSLVKGSTVFINYLAATAHDVAQSKQHKSISASDVLKALEMLEFGDMASKLQGELQTKGKGKEKDLPGDPLPPPFTSAPLDLAGSAPYAGESISGSGPMDVRQSAAVPPLPPSLVLLYLLAPYLKFGALNLPYTQLPLKWGLPALLLSALASAFARQVWYMLARYLRKADLTDILLDTFARGRGKECQRAIIRALVRALLGVVSTLLAVTYLRYSMYTLLPLFAGEHHSVLAYTLSTLLVGLVVSWLSYGRSLNSRRVVYATWLSIATYVAWLGCTIYAHTHGILPDHEGWLGPELSWKGGLATTALAFCSSSTLPLYAALKSRAAHPITTAKTPRTHSFRLLSFVSIIVAVALLLPSVIFAAFPNAPATSSLSLSFQDPLLPSAHTSIPLTAAAASSSFMPTPKPKVLLVNTTTHVPLLPGTLHPPLPSDLIPSIQIHTVRRALASTMLLLGIPSLVVTTPPVAIPSLRSVKFNVSRVLILAFILILSLIPPGAFPSSTDSNGSDDGDLETSRGYLRDSGTIFTLLTTSLVILAFAGTYFVPAVVHLASHVFKRPLAIVVPAARTPLVNTPPHIVYAELPGLCCLPRFRCLSGFPSTPPRREPKAAA
ncbi:hypothetical protein NLJ89_g9107 [Agrocybe chaxingu]|uniref:DNA polymerase epsilon subunit D n=1 Tax=Agrocybe chaxingu TaxID=84603 RepID=A0A9W8JTD1_9AGAR|nr:hypothetical protein NLJ89_g9107 [Agrocybe chaxingu]